MRALETPLFPESSGRLVRVGDVLGLPVWGVRAVHRSDGRAVPHARDLVLDDERPGDLPYGQARSRKISQSIPGATARIRRRSLRSGVRRGYVTVCGGLQKH